jgi:hypothetical protein
MHIVCRTRRRLKLFCIVLFFFGGGQKVRHVIVLKPKMCLRLAVHWEFAKKKKRPFVPTPATVHNLAFF